MRVRITVCATSGRVSSRRSAAAAAAKAGTPGVTSIGDAERVEPAHLLGDRAIERRIAGMHARDILPAAVRGCDLGDDLVQGQRRGVDDRAPGRRGVDHVARGTSEPA